MDNYKKEVFDRDSGEFLSEGYNLEDLAQCDRCYRVEPYEFLTNKHDQLYCECCYDDLFVSWTEAFRRVSNVRK
jgi:hypothetical protein